MDSQTIRIISRFARLMGLRGMISLSGERAVIPFYHVVSDQDLPHIKHLYRYRSINEFQKDLDDLLLYYEPVDLSEFLQKERNTGKQNTVLLTFDDGLSECHQVIAPILKRKGIPAVFFLNNQFIDNKDLFFRYKISILIEELHSHPEMIPAAARHMSVKEQNISRELMATTYSQRETLDTIADLLSVDFRKYMEHTPVYMSSEQVKELLSWGFEIGGHSFDHPRFASLSQDEMIRHVQQSMEDLQKRFNTNVSGFAFPFTSDGIPENVIETLEIQEGISLLLGTSGLKKTNHPGFIQRVDMETFGLSALDVLKMKYLLYLMRKPVGLHLYKY